MTDHRSLHPRCPSGAMAALVTLAAACSKHASEPSVLQASDLQTNGAAFDPNEIVDLVSMQDARALDESHVQAFLADTPYGAASFLSSYSSDGTSAAEAIVAAAQQYRLNPLVFLVRAQMDQGLVGATDYPSPSSRVEFAFGCGCAAPGDCDSTYSGFDVQVDCLGAALRESLDAVAAHGQTDGGWGPGIAGTTLDGVQVTPKDASTSALYQYTPVVAQGAAGGNWLFWNLWTKYAAAVGAGGGVQDGGVASGWVGGACSSSVQCVYGGMAGTCATQFPGGLCTLACTSSCPSQPGETQTFCADFGAQGGFCLAVCDPSNPQCRSGYACKSVKQLGDTTTSQDVCFPG